MFVRVIQAAAQMTDIFLKKEPPLSSEYGKVIKSMTMKIPAAIVDISMQSKAILPAVIIRAAVAIKYVIHIDMPMIAIVLFFRNTTSNRLINEVRNKTVTRIITLLGSQGTSVFFNDKSKAVYLVSIMKTLYKNQNYFRFPIQIGILIQNIMQTKYDRSKPGGAPR